MKNVLTIGFDPEFAEHIAMVDNAKNHTLIATKLAELGHPGAQVKIIQAERPEGFATRVAPASEPSPAATSSRPMPPPVANAPLAARPAASPASPPKPAQLDPGEFKNDPLIKKALEVFKGTIVEVRA